MNNRNPVFENSMTKYIDLIQGKGCSIEKPGFKNYELCFT